MSNWRTAFAWLAAAAGVAGCGGSDDDGGSSKEKEFAAIRAELETFAADNQLPGLAYAVVIDGKLANSGALGVKTAQTGEVFTSTMVVPTGSIAVKLLVATEVLKLSQQGKVDLDAPVTDALPWLKLPAGSEAVTFQQALVMRSGLSNPMRKDCPDPSLKGSLAGLTSYAPPGDIWVYSTSGFTLSAAAIEEIAKRRFEEVLGDDFLAPMGMTSATFDATEAMKGDYSMAHVIGDDGSLEPYELDALPHCTPGFDCSVCEEFRAGAGLFLSADHLASMLERLTSEEAPFDAATLEAIDTRAGPTGWGQSYRYGMGVFSVDVEGKHFLFAGTEYAGVTGIMGWATGTGVGVLLVANAMPETEFLHPKFQRKVTAIAGRFLGLNGAEPDFTTPPATWSKYVGKYGPPGMPYEVTLAGDELSITNKMWPKSARMLQGGGFAWAGGDAFQFMDPFVGAERNVTFFAGSGNGEKMQYMVDAGGVWMVAERLPD